MSAGVESFSNVRAEGASGALADVVTLEARKIILKLDDNGVRIDSAIDDEAISPLSFDSVNSLLLNTSQGFVAHFNGSLAAALAQVVRERAAEEADEADDNT